MIQPNNHMHSDNKKRRSFVTLLFAAGDVKRYPYQMNRTHDIEGEFHIIPTNLGGRQGPAFSGYRPVHKVHDNYLTSAQHEYVGVTQVAPGETAHAKVWFITPDGVGAQRTGSGL